MAKPPLTPPPPALPPTQPAQPISWLRVHATARMRPPSGKRVLAVLFRPAGFFLYSFSMNRKKILTTLPSHPTTAKAACSSWVRGEGPSLSSRTLVGQAEARFWLR
nr:hypothetical protein [Morchella crassipes]